MGLLPQNLKNEVNLRVGKVWRARNKCQREHTRPRARPLPAHYEMYNDERCAASWHSAMRLFFPGKAPCLSARPRSDGMRRDASVDGPVEERVGV